jgi:hypothetical protein
LATLMTTRAIFASPALTLVQSCLKSSKMPPTEASSPAPRPSIAAAAFAADIAVKVPSLLRANPIGVAMAAVRMLGVSAGKYDSPVRSGRAT